MAKDNSPGLLSKVAMFVRNPTKDWSELERPDSEPESGYSKQALKEMIERKRQNDFVRKREFDQLRKLRRREPGVGLEQDPGRPSFFQSSLPSNQDDRAVTLKKIDEIEAQMSKQWWKGKQDEASARAGTPTEGAAGTASQSEVQTLPSATSYAATQVAGLRPDSSVNMGAQTGDFAATQMSPSMQNLPLPKPRASFARPGTPVGGGAAAPSRATSGYSSSQLFATELGDGGTDPDLEEAAIRFANGDDVGAEAGLLDALGAQTVNPVSADGWIAALFDFYRATGQQERFDTMALEFAQRFGRSAPAWFSIPEMLGLRTSAGSDTSPTALRGKGTHWDCPSELTQEVVQDLINCTDSQPAPWHVNWSHVSVVNPNAELALQALFSQWCLQPVSLRFEGSANLERVLRARAVSGDKTVHKTSWQILMDALRVMRLQDEFELVALDYCVTFEVSPPSWKDAKCDYESEGREVRANTGYPDTIPSPDVPDMAYWNSVGPRSANSPMGGPDGQNLNLVELHGEILGDAAVALERLEAARQGSDRLVVSCAKLIRVDFSAAGGILNWVAIRQAEGCQVQFRDVHRLVGAFFNVIGISEHARILPRNG